MTEQPDEQLRNLLELIRQAKLEWEATVDALPQLVCLLDTQGKVIRANRTLERWGYGRVQEVKGRDLHDMAHPGCHNPACEFGAFWIEAWDTVLRGEAAAKTVFDDARQRFLLIQVQPLYYARPESDLASTSYAAVIINDITEQKQAEARLARLLDQVRAGREQLQALSRKLLDVQESERRYIARELHDEIGQDLTAIKINLQAVQKLSNSLLPYLEESISIVERTLQQVRNLSLELRPSLLDDLGLLPALRWYVSRTAQRAGFEADFRSEMADVRLQPEVETTCFRVTQSALTNVIRHARATAVHVSINIIDGTLELSVSDNGIGFDVAAARTKATQGSSLGLLSMEERVQLAGGRLQIDSAPGQGTQVRANFPYRVVQA